MHLVHSKSVQLTLHGQESNLREIELEDDNPDDIACLLEYLYTYWPPAFSAAGNVSRALEVFVVADKYCVESLKDACLGWMVELLTKEKSPEISLGRPETVTELVDFGSRLWSGEHKRMENIRDAYIQMVIRNRDVLIGDKEMKALLMSTPDLSYQLIQAMRRRLNDKPRRRRVSQE